MDLFPALPLAFCAMTILYLLYLRLLPKPLPGIPYNEAATRSILGDIPALVKTGRPDVHNWIVEQCVAHDSPVIQLFMRPFRRPWIILTDFQEANDILTRRTREFDRSNFFGDLFIAMLPSFQAHMSTGPEWKAHRKLTGDLMASSFLNDTLSERIHEATQDLIELWKGKTRLAKDRPFTAKQDVSCAALDGIWCVTKSAQVPCKVGSTADQCRNTGSHHLDQRSELRPLRLPRYNRSTKAAMWKIKTPLSTFPPLRFHLPSTLSSSSPRASRSVQSHHSHGNITGSRFDSIQAFGQRDYTRTG